MKRPKQRRENSGNIRLIEERYNSEDNPPRFSFRSIVNHSDFNYESLQKEHKVDLINKLYMLSQLTWAQIRLQDRHKLGCEVIKRESLKFTLPDGVPDEYPIIAFRFSDKAPMLGYRSAFGTFYIIAFDTKFKAYEH
jgi:hypothetical protein